MFSNILQSSPVLYDGEPRGPGAPRIQGKPAMVSNISDALLGECPLATFPAFLSFHCNVNSCISAAFNTGGAKGMEQPSSIKRSLPR